MGSQGKQYTAEFKREAVRLVAQNGISWFKPLVQAARDLGINDNMLYVVKRVLAKARTRF